jgi:hypothetical protein
VKNKYTYLVMFLLVAALGYMVYDAISFRKEFSAKEEQYKEKVDSIQYVILELQHKVNLSETLVDIAKEETKKFKDKQEESESEAKKYKEEYYKLKNKKPITVQDSLEVCEEITDVLLKQVGSLEEAVANCDSVYVIQTKTIGLQRDVINTKDLIIENKDRIIALKDTELKDVKATVQKEKTKSLIKGLGIGGAVVFLLMIL